MTDFYSSRVGSGGKESIVNMPSASHNKTSI